LLRRGGKETAQFGRTNRPDAIRARYLYFPKLMAG
jgi:hypothetical protein